MWLRQYIVHMLNSYEMFKGALRNIMREESSGNVQTMCMKCGWTINYKIKVIL